MAYQVPHKPKPMIITRAVPTAHVLCPRCLRMTGEGRWNYSGLCDPCCTALTTVFSMHPAVTSIEAAYNMQRKTEPWK
jgi:hypothetical protein